MPDSCPSDDIRRAADLVDVAAIAAAIDVPAGSGVVEAILGNGSNTNVTRRGRKNWAA